MSWWEFPDLKWVAQNSLSLPICLFSYWALKAMPNANIMYCSVFLKQKSVHGQPVWSLSREAIVTADGVLFVIQVAEMAVKQYEYCVKVVNVTACYCLGTCTEQVSVLLKMFILWGYSSKVGRYVLEPSAAAFGHLAWAHIGQQSSGEGLNHASNPVEWQINFLSNKAGNMLIEKKKKSVAGEYKQLQPSLIQCWPFCKGSCSVK